MINKCVFITFSKAFLTLLSWLFREFLSIKKFDIYGLRHGLIVESCHVGTKEVNLQPIIVPELKAKECSDASSDSDVN